MASDAWKTTMGKNPSFQSGNVKARIPRSCPHCKGHDIHRSRRRGLFERFLLPLFFVRPYRCYSCLQRFYGTFSPIGSTDGRRDASSLPHVRSRLGDLTPSRTPTRRGT
jgi:hypothetical protein